MDFLWESTWIKINPLELLAISGFWIALLVLAVHLRQTYILKEEELSQQQQSRLRPEMDLSRRFRLWCAVSFLGFLLSFVLFLNINYESETKTLILNLSSFFTSLSILFGFVAYLRYLFITYILDSAALVILVEPIRYIRR